MTGNPQSAPTQKPSRVSAGLLLFRVPGRVWKSYLYIRAVRFLAKGTRTPGAYRKVRLYPVKTCSRAPKSNLKRNSVSPLRESFFLWDGSRRKVVRRCTPGRWRAIAGWLSARFEHIRTRVAGAFRSSESFPEIDRAEFFPEEIARRKINSAQVELIERLHKKIITIMSEYTGAANGLKRLQLKGSGIERRATAFGTAASLTSTNTLVEMQKKKSRTRAK